MMYLFSENVTIGIIFLLLVVESHRMADALFVVAMSHPFQCLYRI